MSFVALRTPFWRLSSRFIQPLHSGKVFHPAGFPRAVNQCGVGRFHESIVPRFLLPNYKQSSSFADHSEKHQQGEDSHLATSGAPSTHPRGINVKLCKLLLAFPVLLPQNRQQEINADTRSAVFSCLSNKTCKEAAV